MCLVFMFRKKCQNFHNIIISNISAYNFNEQTHGPGRTINPLSQVMELLIFRFLNSVFCLLKRLAFVITVLVIERDSETSLLIGLRSAAL